MGLKTLFEETVEVNAQGEAAMAALAQAAQALLQPTTIPALPQLQQPALPALPNLGGRLQYRLPNTNGATNGQHQ